MALTHAVLSFALLGALLTITPGLDTALVLRSAVTMGRARASETAYLVLRIAGAVYMIHLGIRMIFNAVRPGRTSAESPKSEARAPSVWNTFGRGLPGSVVLADVRSCLDRRSGREAHDRGHLPGAIFVDLDLDHDLAAPASPADGRHPLPDPAAFADRMASLGFPITTRSSRTTMPAG